VRVPGKPFGVSKTGKSGPQQTPDKKTILSTDRFFCGFGLQLSLPGPGYSLRIVPKADSLIVSVTLPLLALPTEFRARQLCIFQGAHS
jgi:hypothetical protein